MNRSSRKPELNFQQTSPPCYHGLWYCSASALKGKRQAFTLVELLVAMAIFITLATLTISAWRGNDEDRVSNAAATFKNALEGAKSRALKSGENRGLRLVLAPDNNRIVTSVMYIDGGQFLTGQLVAEYDNRDADSPFNDTVVPNSSGRWRVTCADADVNLWNTLALRGLIGGGTLIEIPTSSSNWMRFTGQKEQIAGRDWWILDAGGKLLGQISKTPDPDPPANGRNSVTFGVANAGEPGIGLDTSTATAPLNYRMQLMPALLAGADPITFPANTCIDLDGSKVPAGWRPTPIKPNYGPQSGYMDIIFSPRGGVNRPLTTEGVLHFRVGAISDLILAQGSSTSLPNTQAAPIVITDPEHGGKLVSIITQTGITLNADVYPSLDVNSGFNNDAYNFNAPPPSAVSPYYYVLYGKESK